MASFVFQQGANHLLGASTAISWTGDTIKARLVASSVTPNKDDDVMTGYTAIGTDQTLGTKAGPTIDDANDRNKYTAANPTWTAVAGGSTVGWVVLYKFVTNDADSIPITNLDVPDTPTNGGDIAITFDTTGCFYLQD
jgi:hypothetical protein